MTDKDRSVKQTSSTRDISVTVNRYPLVLIHPGGNPGADLQSISQEFYLREEAFEWELTKETICLPLGCLQDGVHQISREQAPHKGKILPLSKYLNN